MFFPSIQQIFRIGNERRTLASCRNVTYSEITYRE